MALTITLDDAAINDSRFHSSQQQKVIQGSDYLPVEVDLSVEITLGLAILTAVAAQDLLWDQLNNMSEEDILRAITSIAFVTPAEAVSIRAYQGSLTHVRAAPAGDITYLPFSRLYRNYVLGGATAVILDVGFAV